MSIITSTHRPYIIVLREKSDKDGPGKGGKCDTEKDASCCLESRHVSHYRCYDSHFTDLELTHGNPTHIDDFPSSLSALSDKRAMCDGADNLLYKREQPGDCRLKILVFCPWRSGLASRMLE
jgi:hypothetical protein